MAWSSCNKALPEPMLAHMASLGHNEVTKALVYKDFAATVMIDIETHHYIQPPAKSMEYFEAQWLMHSDRGEKYNLQCPKLKLHKIIYGDL